MCDLTTKEKFLKGFIIYTGIFEIIIAVFFTLFKLVCNYLGYDCIPLFYLMAAVELAILGILLLYSAKDLKRYLIIPVLSCAFRFIMIIPSIYTAIVIPEFRYILIGTMSYDVISAIVTLVLLKQCNYFSKPIEKIGSEKSE